MCVWQAWIRVGMAVCCVMLVISGCAGIHGPTSAGTANAAAANPLYVRPTGSFQVPDFPPGLPWYNVKAPLTMRSLRGKMVLLDFWTYGCINCMHVIPQLKILQNKFPNSLVVIGVHSPKFANEHVDANLKEAVLRYKIDHPVVNDAQMSLWRALNVDCWPTVILVDPDGFIAGAVAGEGVMDGLLPVIEKVAAAYRNAGRLDERPFSLDLEAERAPRSFLSFPGKVIADAVGNRLFIADSGHDRIVVISPDGKVQEIIGSGQEGRVDGSFEKASFHTPQGMALVGKLLYVADTNNHLIRVVDLAKRTVRTAAGTGRQEQEYGGNYAPLECDLSSPWDVDWFQGSLYIAMAGDHRIWRYQPEQNRIKIFAGTGREARTDGSLDEAAFAQPSGICDDGHFLYVADSESSSIRKIDPVRGQVTSLNSGDLFDFGIRDGDGRTARFQHPLGIVYSGSRLYITDTYNSDIRVLDLGADRVTTLAGANRAGREDGKGGRFYEPGGLAILNGKIYVADTDNGLIRTIDSATRMVGTLECNGGKP